MDGDEKAEGVGAWECDIHSAPLGSPGLVVLSVGHRPRSLLALGGGQPVLDACVFQQGSHCGGAATDLKAQVEGAAFANQWSPPRLVIDRCPRTTPVGPGPTLSVPSRTLFGSAARALMQHASVVWGDACGL